MLDMWDLENKIPLSLEALKEEDQLDKLYPKYSKLGKKRKTNETQEEDGKTTKKGKPSAMLTRTATNVATVFTQDFLMSQILLLELLHHTL